MASQTDGRRVLDVRTIDEPPFDPIVEALEELSEEGTLVIVNGFEPVPLYDVFESRGFDYEATRVDDGEWRIRVTHADRDGDADASASGGGTNDAPAGDGGAVLDVRDVPPPQRHPKIHDAFAELEAGEALTIVNDHEPKPLYYEFAAEVESFDAEGYEVERRGPTEFVARFPKR